jgi:hypothetical protein
MAKTKHPPRSGDLPLEECALAAMEHRRQGRQLFQKWTCSHCGARNTMSEPDKFYTSGVCEDCDAVTRITHCGYMLVIGARAPRQR